MVASKPSERALMRAVLLDAVDCVAASRGRRPAWATDARAWLDSRDRDWPYAFERVCDTLGMDAAAIRRDVLDVRATAPRRGGLVLSRVRSRLRRHRRTRSAR